MHLANVIGRSRDTLMNSDHEHQNLNLVNHSFGKKEGVWCFRKKCHVDALPDELVLNSCAVYLHGNLHGNLRVKVKMCR